MTTKLTTTQAEALKSVYKIVTDLIPGGNIAQELIEFQGRVQQDRLNKFSEYIKEGFENVTDKAFDPENLKSEDFIDSFRVIIRKVVETKSEEKLKRYKNVLLKQMFEKNDSEMFMKYVALIEDVNEPQVVILGVLRKYYSSFCKYSDLINHLIQPGENFNRLLVNLINEEDIELPNGTKFSPDELKFYLYDLKSKGLINTFVEEQAQYGKKQTSINIAKETYQISVIGQGFLDFVNEYGGNDDK